VSDVGIKKLRNLEKLHSLFLGGTNVTDDGLVFLSNLKKLRLLNLSRTNIMGEGLEHLKDLPLSKLYLMNTVVGDEGIAALESSSIEVLSLTGTNVTDACVKYLSNMQSLRRLDVKETNMTEQGVKRLQKNLPDCIINF
jgi:hypothetical protein